MTAVKTINSRSHSHHSHRLSSVGGKCGAAALCRQASTSTTAPSGAVHLRPMCTGCNKLSAASATCSRVTEHAVTRMQAVVHVALAGCQLVNQRCLAIYDAQLMSGELFRTAVCSILRRGAMPPTLGVTLPCYTAAARQLRIRLLSQKLHHFIQAGAYRPLGNLYVTAVPVSRCSPEPRGQQHRGFTVQPPQPPQVVRMHQQTGASDHRLHTAETTQL